MVLKHFIYILEGIVNRIANHSIVVNSVCFVLQEEIIVVLHFSKLELKMIVINILAFLFLLMYSPINLAIFEYFDYASYLIFHVSLEFMSLSICFVMAILGWVMVPLTKSRYMFNFSLLFLLVGMFDGIHTLAFGGMPFGLNPDAATLFWMIARITEAIGLILVLSVPDNMLKRRNIKFICTFVSFSGLTAAVILYQSIALLPEPVRAIFNFSAALRIQVEYFIMTLRVITAVFVSYRYIKYNKTSDIYIIQAVMLELVGGFVQVLYSDTADPIMCHIYKAVGYYYLLKGVYLTTITDYFENKRSAEQRFSTLFHTNSSMMAVLNPSGTYFDVNNSFARTFGLPPQDIIGKDISDINLGDGGNMAHLLKKLTKGQSQIRNEEIHYKSISGRITAYLSADIIDFGMNKYILFTLTDITEKRNLEKEIKRLDHLNLVGQMAASIGHEIRNPLTTVRGYLQVMQRRSSDLVFKETISLMIKELDHANNIITEFLTLAKNKRSQFEQQDINELIRNLYPLIKANAMANDRDIKLELGSVTKVDLDPDEIRQVILNLVQNAIEATTQGGEIMIRTYLDKDDVILSVENNGKQIPQEILDKLGTPFFTTKEMGTGLGLAVCYSIVARHNGKVNVKSDNNLTKFGISFGSERAFRANGQ